MKHNRYLSLRFWFPRALLFFATFTLEIRAKADEQKLQKPSFAFAAPARPAQLPDDCLSKAPDDFCAISSKRSQKAILPLGKNSVVLDQASSAARVDSKKAILLSGGFWAKAEDELRVQTEFGDISILRGQAWVWRENGRVWIDALEGDVRILPRGSAVALALDPGSENWLGAVGVSGEAQTGFPRPLDLRSEIARWSKLYPGSKAEFALEASRLSDAWRKVAREIASSDQARAEALKESLHESDARIRVAREQKAARERGLREIFRRKALEE